MTLRQSFGRALARLVPEQKASRTAKIIQPGVRMERSEIRGW